MLKRTLTGAGLVAVCVGFFLLRNLVDARLFCILIGIFCVLGTYELMRALGDRAACMPYVMVYAVAIVPAYVLGGIAAAAIVFALFAVSFVLLFALDRTFKARQLGLTLFAMVYPSFFLVAMAAVNQLGENGYFALLLIFLVSPAADTFAYLVGSLLKGPKLCPKLSPNKTISGAIGGLVGGVAAALALYFILMPALNVPLPAFFVAMIGLVAAVFTECGDLFESFIKRRLEIKDMGKILPGHGGIMDRIDGMLFASAFLCFVFALL